jgi:hypothetical protein
MASRRSESSARVCARRRECRLNSLGNPKRVVESFRQ